MKLKGTVRYFDKLTNQGIVRGDDGNSYKLSFYHTQDIQLEKGQCIRFSTFEDYWVDKFLVII